MISQHEFLEAETLAILVGSEAAFCTGFFTVNVQDDKLQNFWRHSEIHLLKAVPGISLNVLQHLRDKIWFPKPQQITPLPLHCVFRHVGRGLLEEHGGKAKPIENCHSQDKDELQAWRWFSFALPEEIFLSTSFETGVNCIELNHPLLQQNLSDKGFNEIHLHQGAAFTFSMFWVSTLHQLRTDGVNAQILSSPQAVFEHGKFFASWLLAGAIMRQLLLAFLCQPCDKYSNFQSYLRAVSTQLNTRSVDLSWTLNQVAKALSQPESFDPKILSALFQRMQALYREITPEKAGLPKTLDELWCYDPISNFQVPEKPEFKELYLTRKAFQYIESHPEDTCFAQLLWQSLRLKTLLYRHIVQRPMVTGLQWFIRFFERMDAFDGLLKKTTVESAFSLSGGGKGLRSLEIRKPPKDSVSAMKSMIRDQLQTWINHPATQDTELGLVLHLVKTNGSASNKTHLVVNADDTYANPCHPKNYANYRYGHYFRSKCSEISAIQNLLEQVPLALYFIRGIDTCTDELSIPTWVMAPLIQRLDHIGQLTSLRLSQNTSFCIPPFRKTIHAGEDFCHLMEGIRHLDEILTHYPLNTGDRIGHGLALGLKPEFWAGKHAVVWMSSEARLWNLVWEYSIYNQGLVEVSAERYAKIIHTITQLAQSIFPYFKATEKKASELIEPMSTLYENLFCLSTLIQAGFPEGEVFHNNSQASQLLIHYLTNEHCFQESQKVIEVRQTPDEIDALNKLQRYVRMRMIEKEVTIEINPSSNFLIAHLQELKNHPIWYLNPVNPTGDDLPPLKIAIGSDDPITFSTRLPQEYVLINNVMKYMNIDPQHAAHWLNEVRENGLNARFTLGPQTVDNTRKFLWKEIYDALTPEY